VLFRLPVLQGIADGSIDVQFRRWDRPRVRRGTQIRTPIGVLEVDAVTAVATISAEDARRAGYESVDAILADLDQAKPGDTYRVQLHLAGPDPRVDLRNQAPTADEVNAIMERLRRLDRASSHGPWTASVLRAIAQRPAVRAPDLAESFGRETQPFKIDVRKLKELGLTESLAIGYRISPRGKAVLAALAERD
jgi:hypothetical protein